MRGVEKGLFGIGEIEKEKVVCRYFKERPDIPFSEKEVIICAKLCEEQKKEEKEKIREYIPSSEKEKSVFVREKKEEEYSGKDVSQKELRKSLRIRFTLPQGKAYEILKLMNHLQTKFRTLKIELNMSDGEIATQEIENIIKETLLQINAEFEIEEENSSF